MKFLLLVCLVILAVRSCTTAEKVKCLAAAAGCGAICVCDFPVCECCPACIACVTASVADCCDCLFPGWSGCTYENKTKVIIPPLKNSTITAMCQTIIKNGQACASAQCIMSSGQICCDNGHMATCNCNNGYANCFCN